MRSVCAPALASSAKIRVGRSCVASGTFGSLRVRRLADHAVIITEQRSNAVEIFRCISALS